MTAVGNGAAAALEANEARFDRWVNAMGGYSSERFAGLHREALEFAGPDECMRYLDFCREFDEDITARKARESARAAAREARRQAEEAAAATLKRVTGIKLAADMLASDPRLGADPDFSTRVPMGRAEVDLELRAAMGLANRAPTAYEAMLPAVADLARTIGVKR